jgi:L-gulono-1,4-lactone dehydrogenase
MDRRTFVLGSAGIGITAPSILGCTSVSPDTSVPPVPPAQPAEASPDVSGLLRDQLGETSDEGFERLVAAEVANPGGSREAATGLLEQPDGPLEPVTVMTACELVDKVAADRWGVDSSQILRPTDLGSIVAMLEQAQAERTSLRFVGAARSLSVASQPASNGKMVATCDYGRELELEADTFRASVNVDGLYSAEAGRVLADVLIDLDRTNRALADMGSGVFQSLAGALSTSTHGSGMRYPSLPGIVRSLDVATFDAKGRVVKRRIEPTAGITDPRKFAARHGKDDLELVQDDKQFQAWTVSLGCLGAIYSLVIDVIPTYWLDETRTVEWWSDVRHQMDRDLNSVDYYEILVSPWPETNAGKPDHACLVTRRVLVTDPARQHVTGGRPLAMKLVQTQLGRLAAEVELGASLRRPLTHVAKMLHTGVHATQVPGYTDKWFEVLLLRMNVNADSSEIGVPLQRTSPTHVDPANAIAATEDILARAQANQAQMQSILGHHEFPFDGEFEKLCRAWAEAPLHTSPISLRFVKEEVAFLSMQVATPTCMIEMPMPGSDYYDSRVRGEHPHEAKHLRLYQAYVQGRTHLFETIENDLRKKFNARPHWGQRNFMTWATTEHAYPGARSWRAIYDVANGSGVFDNPLTDQLGISKRPPA